MWSLGVELLTPHEPIRESMGPKAIQQRKLAMAEAENILKELAKKRVWVIFEKPSPEWCEPLFRFVDWINRGNLICKQDSTIDKSYLEESRKPVVISLDRLRLEFPNVEAFDPLPVVCPEERCLAIDDKGPIVFDADHLSGHANDLLKPAFWRLISHLRGHLPDRAVASAKKEGVDRDYS